MPVARSVDMTEDPDPRVSRTVEARNILAGRNGPLNSQANLPYVSDTHCIRLVLPE